MLLLTLLLGAARVLTAGASRVPDNVVLEPAVGYGKGGTEPLLLNRTRHKQGEDRFRPRYSSAEAAGRRGNTDRR